MSDPLTDERLEGILSACIVERRVVPTLKMRVDDMDLIVRAIREQRAEIERLNKGIDYLQQFVPEPMNVEDFDDDQ